jgi:carbon-monoxide dehydrogenase medium subunit
LDGGDRVSRCAIALIGLGPTPVRAAAAEAGVVGSGVDAIDPTAVGQAAVAGLDGIPADVHGSAAYRARVGAVMVGRAVVRALEEARGG